MGAFWTSLAVRASDQREVAEALRRLGRTATVGVEEDGWVPVFDSACDGQDEREIVLAGAALTKELQSSGLAVLAHEGDALTYWLFDRGHVLDKYESWPNYGKGGKGAEPKPRGGDAGLLCRVLGVRCDESDVRSVLHELGSHADALFLHESLAKMLGIPATSIGASHGHLREAGAATDEAQDDLLHVEASTIRGGRPRVVITPRHDDGRAQLLPFVRPGSAPEEDLVAIRAAMMDEVAEKLIADGGVDGFLDFLAERLAELATADGPGSLRALQAQLPLLQALWRRSSGTEFKRRVAALLHDIEKAAETPD